MRERLTLSLKSDANVTFLWQTLVTCFEGFVNKTTELFGIPGQRASGTGWVPGTLRVPGHPPLAVVCILIVEMGNQGPLWPKGVRLCSGIDFWTLGGFIHA
jgi:hypothetical protein